MYLKNNSNLDKQGTLCNVQICTYVRQLFPDFFKTKDYNRIGSNFPFMHFSLESKHLDMLIQKHQQLSSKRKHSITSSSPRDFKYFSLTPRPRRIFPLMQRSSEKLFSIAILVQDLCQQNSCVDGFRKLNRKEIGSNYFVILPFVSKRVLQRVLQNTFACVFIMDFNYLAQASVLA